MLFYQKQTVCYSSYTSCVSVKDVVTCNKIQFRKENGISELCLTTAAGRDSPINWVITVNVSRNSSVKPIMPPTSLN